MSTDDQLTPIPSMTKRPISRKNRIRTQSQTRLPSLISKSSVFLSTSETSQFKRHPSHHKDILNTSSASKNDRQARLPPLNDTNLKQRADFQRRQIYALNHLMRELEQEQFRQYCKLNGIGTENSVEITSTDDDSNKQLTTTTTATL